MKVKRQEVAVLTGVALAAIVPLAPVGAHTVSQPMTQRSKAGDQRVLHLQVTGAYQYNGTLTGWIDEYGTGRRAGKSGKSPAYVALYNALSFSGKPASSGMVFEAGVQPYQPGSTSPSRGNRTVAIAFTAKGVTYQAGIAQAAIASSLELGLTAGGRHGSFTGPSRVLHGDAHPGQEPQDIRLDQGNLELSQRHHSGERLMQQEERACPTRLAIGSAGDGTIHAPNGRARV